jgi:L-ascorbate metabolism protein UlaG (beta-lactamase superfamily)
MELSKHGHSCVRIDDGDRTLVLDPGAFSDLDTALDGADAVLITHEHPDHLNTDRVRAAAKADPRLRIWAPRGVASTFEDLGEQVVAVGPGETVDAAGFRVRTFGGQHALIHPLIPIVANVGYLIVGSIDGSVDGSVYHPGDSFTVPDAPVGTLLFPAVAPWSKMAEVIDFLIAVRAPTARPIHDAIVNDLYLGILRNNVGRLLEPHGVAITEW